MGRGRGGSSCHISTGNKQPWQLPLLRTSAFHPSHVLVLCLGLLVHDGPLYFPFSLQYSLVSIW